MQNPQGSIVAFLNRGVGRSGQEGSQETAPASRA
jgi:hypothetical protein